MRGPCACPAGDSTSPPGRGQAQGPRTSPFHPLSLLTPTTPYFLCTVYPQKGAYTRPCQPPVGADLSRPPPHPAWGAGNDRPEYASTEGGGGPLVGAGAGLTWGGDPCGRPWVGCGTGDYGCSHSILLPFPGRSTTYLHVYQSVPTIHITLT